MPQFQLTSPDGQQQPPVILDRLPLQIGRGEDADLRLDDGSVSRLHALVAGAEDRLWIEDNDSLNGVWINGKRITQRVELKNRDRIMLGDFELVYLT
jgi:pSer/pThr/pTyr-binding forkhead associated (FHA) protein